MSSPVSPNANPNVAELRKRTLTLVASVVVLDAAIIGLYYWLHIRDRSIKTQETFVATWVVLTLLVITTQMRHIRKLRPRRR